MKKIYIQDLLKNKKGEVASFLTLISMGLIVTGIFAGNIINRSGTRTESLAYGPPADPCEEANEGQWKYVCTENVCWYPPHDVMVGVPYKCIGGNWVIQNEYGECTNACPNPEAEPSPTPGNISACQGKEDGFVVTDCDHEECYKKAGDPVENWRWAKIQIKCQNEMPYETTGELTNKPCDTVPSSQDCGGEKPPLSPISPAPSPQITEKPECELHGGQCLRKSLDCSIIDPNWISTTDGSKHGCTHDENCCVEEGTVIPTTVAQPSAQPEPTTPPSQSVCKDINSSIQPCPKDYHMPSCPTGSPECCAPCNVSRQCSPFDAPNNWCQYYCTRQGEQIECWKEAGLPTLAPIKAPNQCKVWLNASLSSTVDCPNKQSDYNCPDGTCVLFVFCGATNTSNCTLICTDIDNTKYVPCYEGQKLPEGTFVPLGYTNQDWENVISGYSEGKYDALTVSLYISKAARIPGLQMQTCDPQRGGCDYF